MARVAILDIGHLAYEYNFGAVSSLLADAGHEVTAFYDSAEPPKDKRVRHGRCYWQGMALTPILQFKPDYTLVFNGSHPHRYSATHHLSYFTKIVYAENGWLPQDNNMYLDRVGVGSRSSLFLNPHHPERTKDYLDKRAQVIAGLKKTFAPKPLTTDLPKNYVLVPLQLENDTSVVYDSPYFKSIRVFVHYVHWHFSDHPIVIKPHPKDTTPWNFSIDGAVMVDKSVRMNDLVPGAKLVVGITSTSLIEALVHHKPVVAVGNNVASGKGAYVGEAQEMFLGTPRAVLDRTPNVEAIDDVLYMLAQRQFQRAAPPKSVLQFFGEPG